MNGAWWWPKEARVRVTDLAVRLAAAEGALARVRAQRDALVNELAAIHLATVRAALGPEATT